MALMTCQRTATERQPHGEKLIQEFYASGQELWLLSPFQNVMKLIQKVKVNAPIDPKAFRPPHPLQ